MPVTPELVAYWRSLGMVGVVVGTQVGVITRQQLQVCQDGGLRIAAYKFLIPASQDGFYQVAMALQRCEGFPIEFLALDVEGNQWWGWPGLVMDAIQAMLSRGMDPVIYTSASEWAKLVNAPWAGQYRLWAANYRLDLPVPPEGFSVDDLQALPLGWEQDKLIMWQYRGTTDLGGVGVDCNLKRGTEV